MLRYHMTVVTPDNRLKREIKRVTTATGSKAQFVSNAQGLDMRNSVDLVIYDARQGDPPWQIFSRLPVDTSISYVLPPDSLIQKIGLLRDPRVCSLLCYDDRFDEDEFIASTTKVLRGEVFGLAKYFPWGVTTYSMVPRNHEQKSRAIEIVLKYAQEAGVRGPVRERVQLVADELMINALYHAPVDEQGNELYANIGRKELASRKELKPIEVQYGCSGRYFGISVRDGGGSLTRPKALEYMMRVQRGAAADIEDKATGAGLGLQSVMRSVSKLVFNLDPGNSTEVIALFDLDQFARGKVGARSLHIFVASRAPDVEIHDIQEEPPPPPVATASSTSGAFKWMVLAILMAIAAALGTATFMKDNLVNAEPPPPPPAPRLMLGESPANLKIFLEQNGKKTQLRPDKSVPLKSQGTYQIEVVSKKAPGKNR
ncbi:MAG: ATP-binding protein [Proteobacteria bacterium]|nr:ATP-binding protein [Pseudomonadota bacterium]